MTSSKLLHISAPGCHLQGEFLNKVTEAKDSNKHYLLVLLFLGRERLSDDDNPVAETCRSLLLVINCVLLRAFVS